MVKRRLILTFWSYFLFHLECVECFRYIHLNSRIEGEAITNHEIGSVTTYSGIGCARICLNTGGCFAVSYECKNMETTQQGLCKLVSEEGSVPYVMVSDSSMCYMKVADRYPLTSTTALVVTPSVTLPGTAMNLQSSTGTVTSTPYIPTPSLTPQVTTSTFPVIIDMVDNVQNMCTTTSQRDLAVITTEAVYIYDNKDFLKIGSCKSVSIASMFKGFGDLPDVSQWSAVLTVQKSYIDVYADPNFFRWTISSADLVPAVGYPKNKRQYFEDIKGSMAIFVPSDLTWAVVRETLGSHDFFGYQNMGSGLWFYSNHSPHEWLMQINDTSETNQNGNPINPWIALPTSTVALTAAENDGIDFVGITDAYNVVYYNIDHPYDLSVVPTSEQYPLVF
ncbi:uncharacterized protein LOC134249179 [Saccostrea cucullata]|uniref:uncharacterized protein LOC134249179 n=1 Tax=Saccostrea cuccullata TaxID=36930 RepID=UPI002ECFF366